MSLDRKLLSLVAAGLIGLTALSCSPASSGRTNSGSSSGCSKDSDCKGDRVCYAGECVSPSLGDVSSGKDAGYVGGVDSVNSKDVCTRDNTSGCSPVTLYSCEEFAYMYFDTCCSDGKNGELCSKYNSGTMATDCNKFFDGGKYVSIYFDCVKDSCSVCDKSVCKPKGIQDNDLVNKYCTF